MRIMQTHEQYVIPVQKDGIVIGILKSEKLWEFLSTVGRKNTP